MEWIETADQLPPRGEWVLVDKEDWQKPCEVMCYQGIRLGHQTIHHIDGTVTDEDYEYPSWTSGHGDIRPSHPIRWMPLPETETIRKLKEGKLL